MKNVNCDFAYEHIRKKILNGDYPPGGALMTERLALEIGVSRTPVRDALRQLETDGLVSIQARLGASVKKMDVKEFREMCEVRLALESHAAGLAALDHREAELHDIQLALEAMRRLVERIGEGGEEPEPPRLDELVLEDVRFHIAIMTAAHNDLMKKEILRLHLINRVVAAPAHLGATATRTKAEWDANRAAVLAEHEEIHAAIAGRNAPAAKAAMERHIQDIINKNLRAMARGESGLITRDLTDDELAYTP